LPPRATTVPAPGDPRHGPNVDDPQSEVLITSQVVFDGTGDDRGWPLSTRFPRTVQQSWESSKVAARWSARPTRNTVRGRSNAFLQLAGQLGPAGASANPTGGRRRAAPKPARRPGPGSAESCRCLGMGPGDRLGLEREEGTSSIGHVFQHFRQRVVAALVVGPPGCFRFCTVPLAQLHGRTRPQGKFNLDLGWWPSPGAEFLAHGPAHDVDRKERGKSGPGAYQRPFARSSSGETAWRMFVEDTGGL